MSQQPHRPRFGFTRHGAPVHLDTSDYHRSTRWYDQANKKIAVFITNIVGTMWCAYVFAIFDCLALPTAIGEHLYGIVQWVASFFLQLVLLSVIMVGQNLQSAASDARAAKTFEDVEHVIDLLRLDTEGGLKDLYDRLHAEITPLNVSAVELSQATLPAESPGTSGYTRT
jgi:hypothetical protein